MGVVVLRPPGDCPAGAAWVDVSLVGEEAETLSWTLSASWPGRKYVGGGS